MTGNHANGKTAAPFDLEASARAAAGETEVPFAFTYKGESYAVPPSSAWPMPALRALAAGDLETALGTLLGDDEYERLCAAGLTLGELGHLFESIAGKAGLTNLPNSLPPARRASTRT